MITLRLYAFEQPLKDSGESLSNLFYL